MKLGIVCGSLSRGGAERVSIYLAKYIYESGIETIIITNRKGENEYPVPIDIKRFSLNKQKHLKHKILSLFWSIFRIRKIIKKEKIDVILIMGVSTCIYAIPGCIGAKVRIIVSERNDPTHFNGKKIVKICSRFLMKNANNYVFQTVDAMDYYKKILKGRGRVIPNPIILENIPKPYYGQRDNIIVSVGRLVAQKNHKILLKAFAKVSSDFPEIRLFIYGSGELLDSLKDYAADMGIKEKVVFVGAVEDVMKCILTAKLFILSSDFEGMPNALIEAMAIGLPCISTDCPCGGPRSLIQNRKNGLLVPVGNSDKLAGAIFELLRNTDLSKNIGMKAVEIRDYLNIEKIGPQWKDILFPKS